VAPSIYLPFCRTVFLGAEVEPELFTISPLNTSDDKLEPVVGSLAGLQSVEVASRSTRACFRPVALSPRALSRVLSSVKVSRVISGMIMIVEAWAEAQKVGDEIKKEIRKEKLNRIFHKKRDCLARGLGRCRCKNDRSCLSVFF